MPWARRKNPRSTCGCKRPTTTLHSSMTGVQGTAGRLPFSYGCPPVAQGAARLKAGVRHAVVLLLQQAARGGDAGAVHGRIVCARALQRQQAARERLGVHCGRQSERVEGNPSSGETQNALHGDPHCRQHFTSESRPILFQGVHEPAGAHKQHAIHSLRYDASVGSCIARQAFVRGCRTAGNATTAAHRYSGNCGTVYQA